MDPRTKRTRPKTVGSHGKGRNPNRRRSNLSAPTAKAARTAPRRIDIKVKHVISGPPSMHPSQQHAYPSYSPPPPQQLAYTEYPSHSSQNRRTPAYLRHLPPSYAVTEQDLNSEAYADECSGAYPNLFPPSGAMYHPPPPSSAGEFDYLRGTMPPLEYPLETAAYPVVGMLPSHGQYPGMQQPMYQSFLQPPILQFPVYSIGHIYPPQAYPPSFQSLYQPTADQQLLHYTDFPTSVDSSFPGLFELPTKQNNESEEAMAGSTPALHTMSLADATRKFDEILGKRADQRTEEEKKFREEHLAARQSVHTRDAIDRKRRRQMDRIPSCPEE